MKAYIWDINNHGVRAFAVAVAEDVDSARSLISNDINALHEASANKAGMLQGLAGEPDEILDPPFGYIETGYRHLQAIEKEPKSKFLKSLQAFSPFPAEVNLRFGKHRDERQ